jgi:hypothetical protein
MALHRLPAWPELLGKFICERVTQPFAWGTNDCATFACDAVLTMTGIDLAKPLRGGYTTALGAARQMREFLRGLETKLETSSEVSLESSRLELVAEKIAREWLIDEVPILKAQRGDIALLDTELGAALGVVSLNGWEILAPGTEGLMRLPLRSASRAWRI